MPQCPVLSCAALCCAVLRCDRLCRAVLSVTSVAYAAKRAGVGWIAVRMTGRLHTRLTLLLELCRVIVGLDQFPLCARGRTWAHVGAVERSGRCASKTRTGAARTRVHEPRCHPPLCRCGALPCRDKGEVALACADSQVKNQRTTNYTRQCQVASPVVSVCLCSRLRGPAPAAIGCPGDCSPRGDGLASLDVLSRRALPCAHSESCMAQLH